MTPFEATPARTLNACEGWSITDRCSDVLNVSTTHPGRYTMPAPRITARRVHTDVWGSMPHRVRTLSARVVYVYPQPSIQSNAVLMDEFADGYRRAGVPFVTVTTDGEVPIIRLSTRKDY